MTQGEQMVWAAVYAKVYIEEESELRPLSLSGSSRKEAAKDAVTRAMEAVQDLRAIQKEVQLEHPIMHMVNEVLKHKKDSK